MTIERLAREFGPYIAWTQKVTEQGRVKKDTPKKKKEVTVDPNSHKKKTTITIEHHYKVVDTGKPHTVSFSVFGSRLNYPSPEFFSDTQYQHMASELNVEVAAIKALVQQESQGHQFLDNGLPPILYERRHFFDLSVKKREKEAEKKRQKRRQQKRRTPSPPARPKRRRPHIKRGPQ